MLVKDAMLGALTGAMISIKADLNSCKDIGVFDMRVTNPPHDVANGDQTLKGVWNEIWTFKLCGQMVDVGLLFIPTAGGGTRYITSLLKLGEVAGKP